MVSDRRAGQDVCGSYVYAPGSGLAQAKKRSRNTWDRDRAGGGARGELGSSWSFDPRVDERGAVSHSALSPGVGHFIVRWSAALHAHTMVSCPRGSASATCHSTATVREVRTSRQPRPRPKPQNAPLTGTSTLPSVVVGRHSLGFPASATYGWSRHGNLHTRSRTRARCIMSEIRALVH